MDEAKRMEEGLKLQLDHEDAKDELKEQETINIVDSNVDQHGTYTMAKPVDQQPELVKQKTKRVATLDAFRGLTIVVIN